MRVRKNNFGIIVEPSYIKMMLSMLFLAFYAVLPVSAVGSIPQIDEFYVDTNNLTAATPALRLWAHATDPEVDISSCKYRYMIDEAGWSGWLNGEYHPDTYENYNDKVFGAGACLTPDIVVEGATTLSGQIRFTNSNGYSSDSAIETMSIEDEAEVDAIPPTIPTNGLPNGSYKNTNEFDFTWNPSIDNLGSLVTYEFQSTKDPTETDGVLTNGLWRSPNPLSLPMIHSSGAGDGTWYWQVRAIDSVGNKSDWSQIWKVTLDTKAPVVSIISPNSGDILSRTVVISGNIEDANPNHYFLFSPSRYYQYRTIINKKRALKQQGSLKTIVSI